MHISSVLFIGLRILCLNPQLPTDRHPSHTHSHSFLSLPHKHRDGRAHAYAHARSLRACHCTNTHLSADSHPSHAHSHSFLLLAHKHRDGRAHGYAHARSLRACRCTSTNTSWGGGDWPPCTERVVSGTGTATTTETEARGFRTKGTRAATARAGVPSLTRPSEGAAHPHGREERHPSQDAHLAAVLLVRCARHRGVPGPVQGRKDGRMNISPNYVDR